MAFYTLYYTLYYIILYYIMPKNLTGGKYHKRKKNKPVQTDVQDKITFASSNQVYAIVKKKFGGSRLDVDCSDGIPRSALIPGKFFKREWMSPGDILLCELDPTKDASCYIMHKYTPKNANTLRSLGKINFEMKEEKEEPGFTFVEEIKIQPQRELPDIDDIDNMEDEDDFQFTV
jgi:initiation factor 1A